MMQDCIFCKIVKGDIPAKKVYEDDRCLAFLDISPVRPGHTLIIPKQHHETLIDTPKDTLAHLAIVTGKVAAAIKQGLRCGGINLQQNNFPPAGQVVSHIHLHLIPRDEGDGLRLWPQGNYEEGEAEAIQAKISSAF